MALTKVPHGLSAHTNIVDGASSTAITIDADGNVGIGTTAPGAKLHMKDGNNSILLDGRTDGGNVAGTGAANISTIDGIYASNTIPGARIAFAHQGSAGQRGGLTFASKNTDDSSNQPTVQGVLTAFGNWGFGTTNPQYKVEVAGTLGVTGATTFTAATAINANVASPLTINANLNGIAYSEIFNINAGANAAAYFGIVTQNLANSGTIRSGMFFDSSNHLNFINGEAGGAGIVLDDNNAVTMSGTLAVTGGVYLGGTGAANKLDDYEEGTWTPALWQGTHTYTGQIGKYTKIGNMVTVWGKLVLSARGTSGSEFGIVGLPFAGIGSSAGYASVLGIFSGYGSAPLLPTGVDPTGASIEGTYAYFRGTHSTNATYNINQLNSSGEFTFALTYMTA